MKLDAVTEKTGLIGHPVAHSKSPEMMNEAFRREGLPWVYLAFDVASEELGRAVAGLKSLGFRGWNVTIPHKVAVMEHLDEVEESAREIGAVNTVIHRNGRLIGTNTDGAGYLESLVRETGFDVKGRRVVILGAGGAARAVGYTLARAGAEQIGIVNRTEKKAQDLADHLRRWTRADGISPGEADTAIREADLLVQTTSVGMHPHPEGCPVDPASLHKDLLVSDLIYHPRQTRLLQEAKTRGARVHSGLGMLLHQGALAFERWTGRQAPVERMGEVLEQVLGES
ncbi:shikimate dehydrogenase [Kroppenstedtia eburnea]|uniref:Shikimate dehydrogenase (NADP(+)) n=1 Tax=Kroppenstedtia eburnea TaxID=714067 RepID=A0A1N7KVF9_9BACL|nr:shikimate dehydrogenase [Kroppenstedtia eburnea]EGK12562.1 shikimate dehydrogenase [Desmospora sp. 8437]QKI82789.1 shikimate dehydrogenase [Kroppenstedtia eburnea]SIS65593.1 shikimate dehydrogenase [Kroppenstedtia eburnea]